MSIYKKKTGPVSASIFGLGIYLLLASGFSWWKLLLFIFIVLFDIFAGVLGGSAIVANVTYLIMSAVSLSESVFSEYRWMAVLLLSLAGVLLAEHALLGERIEEIGKVYFGKNSFWIFMTAFYMVLALTEMSIAISTAASFPIHQRLLGTENVDWILSWNPELVGICGAGFCVGWMIREWFLVFIEKKRAF